MVQNYYFNNMAFFLDVRRTFYQKRKSYKRNKYRNIHFGYMVLGMVWDRYY